VYRVLAICMFALGLYEIKLPYLADDRIKVCVCAHDVHACLFAVMTCVVLRYVLFAEHAGGLWDARVMAHDGLACVMTCFSSERTGRLVCVSPLYR